MDDLSRRLDNFGPAIQELMKLGGTPGLSLSVATKNQPVYHANYGFRDLQNGLPVTEQTIFPVCSLAKGVSAAAMGILVDEGIASWEMLVKDATASFHPNDTYLYNNTRLDDLYSHRSGISSCGNLVGGCEGNILIGRDDCMQVVNHQTLVPAHLGSFAYNSTAYDACDEGFRSLSGMSLGDFLQQQVFVELGLRRTFIKPPPSNTDNVTKSHNALDDGTPWCIPGPKLGEDGIGCGSGGLRSSAAELIKLYTCFVQSFNHECQTGQTTTPGSPLKQVSKIMSPHATMLSNERGEVSYGLGWARVQLPNSLGHIGLNVRLMPHGMPVIGEAVADELILYHQGTLPGALASVILIPRTESVVLVMGNSLSLTDVPDWVSQMVLEEIIDVPIKDRTDFIAYAKTSIVINLGWYGRITQGLVQGRPHIIKPHKPLESYIGKYVDKSRVFSVVVTVEEGVMFWAFQGLDSERYKLTHYDGNTFTWLQPRNDLSCRGRWVLGNDNDPTFWKVEFGVDEHGTVNKGGAQNLGMFIAGRIIIGLGTGIVAVAAPQLMTEVAYPTHRGKMVSLYMTQWVVDYLVAAWTTFGTFKMNSSWSWRLPSLLQGAPAILQLILSIWVPESPRWLVYKDLRDEALSVLSQYHSCGDHDSRLVRFELLEIEATLEEEKKHKAIQWSEFIRTSGNRKRLWILLFMGFAAQLSGLGLTGYYLTKILNSIAVTNANTQLLINAIAAVWQLCCSILFAMLIDRVGRRGLITFGITTMLVVFIVWTICSALNEERHFSDRPLALAVVAMIFLFQVGYQPFAISTVPYVVECSLYSLRSKTAMIFQFCGYSASFFTGYVNTVALDRIGWRYYIFACAVLGVECVFAWWYLPETKGKGLEEIGQIFDGDELLTGTQAMTKKREEKYRGFDESSLRERKALSASHVEKGEE